MNRLRSLLALALLSFVFAARADSVDVKAPGLILPITQPKSMDCWATAATMLVAWHETTSLTIDNVMARAGGAYVQAFTNNTGLSAAQKTGFLSALRLKAEVPQNFTVKGWADLLKSYGPLWVTTAEGPAQNFSIHARVVTRIFGDGSVGGTNFVLIDPADGQEHTEAAQDFLHKFEQIAIGDLGNGADIRPQVVHF